MTPLFPSLLEQVVFWAVLVLYLVAILTFVATHREKRGKRKREFLSPVLLLLAIPIGVAIGYARIGVLPNWLFYPGEILFAAGTAFTLWSYWILGPFLSAHVHVFPDHKVIEYGPYRYIRHPGYLGQIVAYIGLGFALQSWVALLVFLVVGAVVSASRIRAEEEFLGAELGDSYVNYMRRTKRFLPLVW